MIEKKREIEGEIAWKRKNQEDSQERSSDTPLREIEGVIK